MHKQSGLFIEKLKKKYGETIYPDLLKLQEEETATLQWFGDKYGFTREYSRQLFNKFFRYPYTKKIKQNKERRKSQYLFNREKKRLPQSKVERYKKTSPAYKGALIELLVYEICGSLGFKIAPPYTPHTDLIINKYLCEIKSRARTTRTNPEGPPYYQFSIKKNEYEKLDYLIAYVVPKKEFYIIPKAAIKGLSVYIGEDNNNCYTSKYRSAWHLLKIEKY